MESERVDPDHTVLVEGDRIVAIGRASHLRPPEGAIVVDGSGRYLLPGLTDSHVHITTDMLWALHEPIGVMVRGRWLPRERLQTMLAALR